MVYHKHHIIPKHIGGTDDPSNLVDLTIEEHAEANTTTLRYRAKMEIIGYKFNNGVNV